MKKLKRWLDELFEAEEFSGLDLYAIGEALNDPAVRRKWLVETTDKIKSLHLEIDRRLLNQNEFGLTDLCAKRKAIQEVLEGVLSAKRSIKQLPLHNPKAEVPFIDLDRVTE